MWRAECTGSCDALLTEDGWCEMIAKPTHGSKQQMEEGTLVDVHRAAHDELPHDDTKAVNITGLVQPMLPQDLGCDVKRGAHVRVAFVALTVLHAHRDAKVGDFCSTVLIDGLAAERLSYAGEGGCLVLHSSQRLGALHDLPSRPSQDLHPFKVSPSKTGQYSLTFEQTCWNGLVRGLCCG